MATRLAKAFLPVAILIATPQWPLSLQSPSTSDVNTEAGVVAFDYYYRNLLLSREARDLETDTLPDLEAALELYAVQAETAAAQDQVEVFRRVFREAVRTASTTRDPTIPNEAAAAEAFENTFSRFRSALAQAPADSMILFAPTETRTQPASGRSLETIIKSDDSCTKISTYCVVCSGNRIICITPPATEPKDGGR